MHHWRAHAVPFWVRHPHWTGLATFAVILAAGLLLGGCECGVGWPCPGK